MRLQRSVSVIVALALACGAVGARQNAPAARETLDRAIAAMGGDARLAALKGISLESIGHAWALEQSERPEGPWLAIYYQRTDVRDYAGNRRSMQRQQRFWGSPNWSPAVPVVVAGGAAASFNNQRWAPASAGAVREWEDTVALAPERLLLTARAAPDLRSLGADTKHGVQQDVIGFSWKGQPVKVWLNRWTHLPTGLELIRNDQFGIWGDVTERRWYSYWTLEAGGLMYPRQTTIEWNGLPSSDETVMSIRLDAPIDEAAFAIPDDTRAMFAERAKVPVGLATVRLDEKRVVPITEWLLQLQGNFNVGVVRQPDGVVILEGTTSSAYSSQVLEFVARRFPDVPVKAVVTTSDAWPHIGGMREHAVRGTPIYPLDLNVAILQRLIEAPRTMSPEPGGRPGRPPVMRPVKSRTTIGSGETRIELLPVRGEYGERMMLAWLPGAKVLYSSDLIQPDRSRTGFFMPAMLVEVAAAMEREGITDIDRVFGMHLPPTPWSRVVDAIAAAKAPARQPAK
jgi:hypothetical protein